MQRVLITGGTGFVGTHLVRFLKPSSSKIAVVSSGRSKYCREEGVTYYELDIRSADEVHSVVREFRPTRVYHLAGISAVDLSWNNPRLTFEVNVLGTYNLFDAAMSLPSTPRILNVSTGQVYAPSDRVLTEASPVSPDNPYAASKLMAELLLVQYRRSASGGVITARSFNHTGPGQPPNFVLASISRQFAEMQAGLRPPKLTVGNINVRRDFTDVRDVVHAYVALLDKGRTGEVYNVCSGTAVRLADIIRKFQAMCGTTVNFENDPALARSNDVPQVVGDPAKIRKETGWSPQVSLEETIGALLDHWRQKNQE